MGETWAVLAHAMLPNWQLFWITDAIQADRQLDGIWSYVTKAALYTLAHLLAALTLACLLFEDRDLATDT
jgi:hypothetical protein